MVAKTKTARQADRSIAEQATPRLTVAERRLRGRALRANVPRSSHARRAEAPNRPDPIALLEQQETTRVPELIPIRHARMRVSPFAFFRGSAIVMAGDLAHTPATGIQAQLCGDAHLANFGVYASPERSLLFDVNDFDETLSGPWEWDVKRLAASAYIAGRDNGFSKAACRAATLAVVRSYRVRMAEFAEMRNMEVWYSRVAADDVIALIESKRTLKRAQKQLGKIRQHGSLQAYSQLTEVANGRRVIASNPPFIMRITAEEELEPLNRLYKEYLGTLRGVEGYLLAGYQIQDFALKVVGVGSVGTRCYIMLLSGRDADDPLFLQVKEAGTSVLEAHVPNKPEFAHHGQRVVVGQQLMQAASDIALGWVRGPAGRDFYVRQLRDMKGSAEIENLSPRELELWAGVCGWALARAHARSGDAVQIAAYLGSSDTFDHAITTFAEAYADQNERDYRAFLAAIKTGRMVAAASGT